MKIRNVALLGMGGAALLAASGFRSVGVEIGAPAPTFSLPSSAGKQVSLEDLKGKYVVLEWTNQGCPYVRKHYDSGNMQSTQKWAKDKGVVWLSIVSSAPGKQGYVDAAGGNAMLKEQKMFSSALLMDADGKVGKMYGAKTTPHMYVIDPKGNLIYNGGIDDKPTADQSDIASAKNFVKAALEEAMAGKAVTNATSRPYGCSIKYGN